MTVSGVTYGTGAGVQTAAQTRQPGEVLDKHDFLRLLTVQLKYQDPMDPIKDQDFIAQLAQFTSLEQIQNLNATMERFVALQTSTLATAQAAALIGRTVTVYDEQLGTTVEGKVNAVRFDQGLPLLVVGEGVYTLGDVVQIA